MRSRPGSVRSKVIQSALLGAAIGAAFLVSDPPGVRAQSTEGPAITLEFASEYSNTELRGESERGAAGQSNCYQNLRQDIAELARESASRAELERLLQGTSGTGSRIRLVGKFSDYSETPNSGWGRLALELSVRHGTGGRDLRFTLLSDSTLSPGSRVMSIQPSRLFDDHCRIRRDVLAKRLAEIDAYLHEPRGGVFRGLGRALGPLFRRGSEKRRARSTDRLERPTAAGSSDAQQDRSDAGSQAGDSR